MPTPIAPGYAELVGAYSTLFIGSHAIRLTDGSDLQSIGATRGDDATIGSTAGRLQRARTQDYMMAVVGFQIVGMLDEDGAAVADPVASGLALQRTIKAFPASEAFAFTVRYTEGSDVTSAPASFREFGPWSRPDEAVWYGSITLAIPTGLLS